MRPTASVEPVSWYIWYASATSAISVPMNEMPWPNQSRLNAGLRRSGVTSSAKRELVDASHGARPQRPPVRPSKQLGVVRVEAEAGRPGRVGHARHYRWWPAAGRRRHKRVTAHPRSGEAEDVDPAIPRTRARDDSRRACLRPLQRSLPGGGIVAPTCPTRRRDHLARVRRSGPASGHPVLLRRPERRDDHLPGVQRLGAGRDPGRDPALPTGPGASLVALRRGPRDVVPRRSVLGLLPLDPEGPGALPVSADLAFFRAIPSSSQASSRSPAAGAGPESGTSSTD